MVAPQLLELLVKVRTLARQPKNIAAVAVRLFGCPKGRRRNKIKEERRTAFFAERRRLMPGRA